MIEGALYREVAKLSIAFGTIAFLWSLFGFFAPIAPAAYAAPEYLYSSFLPIEIAGHISFGIVAALPSLNLEIVLFCGASAILIDADHILAATGLPVLGRLAHSIPFIIISAVVLALVSRRSRNPDMVYAATIAAILSHFSFDALAGDGAFPLLSPINFQVFVFQEISWLPFELMAMAIIVIAAARKWSRPPR